LPVKTFHAVPQWRSLSLPFSCPLSDSLLVIRYSLTDKP
jgi:hypothetical protein